MLLIAGLLSACGGGGGDGGGDTVEAACRSSGRAPVVLVWNGVVEANGYRIYYRNAPGSYLQNLGGGLDAGNATMYFVTGLEIGTTYHFAVTAYVSNGESDFSNEACQTIVE